MPGDEEDAPAQPAPNNQRRELPGSGGGAPDLQDQPVVIQKAMRANVLLTVEDGMGSGVIIQRKGDETWILTNHHVIDPTFARTHGLQSTLIPAMNLNCRPMVRSLRDASLTRGSGMRD